MFEKGRKKGTVRFSLAVPPGTRKVALAGSFDDWTVHPMRKGKNGRHAVTLALTPGTYEYKFIVDGQWFLDSDNRRIAANCFGSGNSVCCTEA